MTWNGKTTEELAELLSLLREHNVEAIEIDGLKLKLAPVYSTTTTIARTESPLEAAERARREYEDIMFAAVGGPPSGGES